MSKAETQTTDNRNNDILRLWEEKWTGKKIADYLGIKPYIVAYVVRKNGRVRNPRGPRVATIHRQRAQAALNNCHADHEVLQVAIGYRKNLAEELAALEQFIATYQVLISA